MWYYSLIHLYRQSIELLLKANIFKLEKDNTKRKDILKGIGHDVKSLFDELIKISKTDVSGNKNADWLSLFLNFLMK